jgi:hypothetical protein
MVLFVLLFFIKIRASESFFNRGAELMKNETIKYKTTIKNIFVELDRIGLRYRKTHAGYRKQVYEFMGDAQRIIVKLHQRDVLRRKFTLRAKKAKRSQDQLRFNLSTEVMAMIMGAKSRSARKLASKRGQVLDYLREAGVKVEVTAQQIKSRGGIEKILQDAAKEKSISPKADATSPAPPKLLRSKEKTSAAHVAPIRSNNQEVIVPVWMRLSDRDEILKSAVGSHIKLSTLRVGQQQADLKVTGIKFRTSDEP